MSDDTRPGDPCRAPLLTGDEVMRLLRISRKKLRQLRREGKLRAVVVGPRTLRYCWSDVDALIAALREERCGLRPPDRDPSPPDHEPHPR